jgi:uroporphyrinogen-III synthase
MRRDGTHAEQHAWKLLRDRRMLDLKFRRQVPIASYIVDFYCDELRLVVELDGAVHEDPDQARNNDVRNNHLEELGFQILRVPNHVVLEAPEEFMALIKRVGERK